MYENRSNRAWSQVSFVHLAELSIVERSSSTFAKKVTFQLRFLLTSADIYHCLFGGPLALCLLISFHINSCFFDKITVFVSLFGCYCYRKPNLTLRMAIQKLTCFRWSTAWSSFNLSAPVSLSLVCYTAVFSVVACRH